MANKTELKTASDSTFTTNGVRAITAASHRTFNDTLIDSLDVVDLEGTDKQVAVMYENMLLSAINIIPKVTSLNMADVKDQLLSNIISVEFMHLCTSGDISNDNDSTYPASLISYKGYISVVGTETFFSITTKFGVYRYAINVGTISESISEIKLENDQNVCVKITYIPEE